MYGQHTTVTVVPQPAADEPTLDEARQTMFWWHVPDPNSKAGVKSLVRGTMGEAPDEFLAWWQAQCAKNARHPFDPQHERWVREQRLCELVLQARGAQAR